jgi:hypothetical protein
MQLFGEETAADIDHFIDYRDITNYLGDKKLVCFRNGYRYNHKTT